MQAPRPSRPIIGTLTRLLHPPYRAKRPPSKKVAIVVPLSSRPGLSPDEQVSLRHLYHYLGRYDRFFIAPEGMPVPFPEQEVKRFSRKFFGSVAAHNHLLHWPGFYRAFADYEFIFFYHLDSLAFSDQLLDWCRPDIDYIGPPWLQCPATPWVKKARVGNCGFALLRVESALRVLYARYQAYPAAAWLDLFTRNSTRYPFVMTWLKYLQRHFPRSKVINRPLREWQEMHNPGPNNRASDIFWSDKAVYFDPSFRVATLEQGLAFAFEVAPRTCLEMNHGRMPFGCHAWGRYDRAFWEPHLLKEPAADAHVAVA